MRQNPLSSVAQSVALLILGVIALAFVLFRPFSTAACGGFLICRGSILPPTDNVAALFQYVQHISIVLLILFGILAFIMAALVLSRQDYDMMSALRLASILFFVQGVAAIASVVLGFGVSVFHILAASLILAGLDFVIARVFFSDNDEYRPATFLALTGMISFMSFLPYFWTFVG